MWVTPLGELTDSVAKRSCRLRLRLSMCGSKVQQPHRLQISEDD